MEIRPWINLQVEYDLRILERQSKADITPCDRVFIPSAATDLEPLSMSYALHAVELIQSNAIADVCGAGKRT